MTESCGGIGMSMDHVYLVASIACIAMQLHLRHYDAHTATFKHPPLAAASFEARGDAFSKQVLLLRGIKNRARPPMLSRQDASARLASAFAGGTRAAASLPAPSAAAASQLAA